MSDGYPVSPITAAAKARELLIVEGDSASKAVRAVCDPSHQSVLAMQGKPLNAVRASVAGIANNELYTELLRLLGFPKLTTASSLPLASTIDSNGFERIVLLFDPDADGIHCEALMLMFFERVLPSLLESGSLHAVRPPSHRFLVSQQRSNKSFGKTQLEECNSGEPTAKPSLEGKDGSTISLYADSSIFAYSDEQARRIMSDLRAAGYQYTTRYYRGLAGIDHETLRSMCVSPFTRRLRQLSSQDAEAARRFFGGG